MKKLPLALLLCLPLAVALPACKKDVDYSAYVSEYRKSVYYYKDDDVEVKIYGVDRETPYAMDGIKGNMNSLTEIYFYSKGTPDTVEVQVAGQGGEMSYLAVTQNFYLSFSGTDLSGASLPVTLLIDGKEKKISADNVAEEGVIDGKRALEYVKEYDGDSFKALTEGKTFNAEIYVRLIYDGGCYYYVGVCDRDKNVHAYLVDGADGRIVAERESKAE